jgi:hypothetical protein
MKVTFDDKAFCYVLLMECAFAKKGGTLGAFLEIARKYFGDVIYGRTWAAFADIWEAISPDGRLNWRQAELAAEAVGVDLCGVQEWQNMKKKGAAK